MEYVNQTKDNGVMVLTSELERSPKWLQECGFYKIVWVRRGNVTVEIDQSPLRMEANEIIPLMPNHRLAIPKAEGDYLAILFNRQFYCFTDNDQEMAGSGIFFKGSARVMHMRLNTEQSEHLEKILQLLHVEAGIDHSHREEALRLLLRHLLITCARIAREKLPQSLQGHRIYELFRRYQVLVDLHYKEKKRVYDYARMLGRSPKTLANLFALYGATPPLQIIHDRINAEAKRLLLFTDLTTGKIGQILGYGDDSSFVRFFKNVNNETTLKFRKRMRGKQALNDMQGEG